MANKTKRTRDVEMAILQAIQEGTPVKEAAYSAGGVNASTLYRWRVNDPDFDLAVQRARAIFLQRTIMQITEAGERDWRAAAWMLERTEPAAFGRRVEVEVNAQAQPVTDLLTGETLRESEGDHKTRKELGSGANAPSNDSPNAG